MFVFMRNKVERILKLQKEKNAELDKDRGATKPEFSDGYENALSAEKRKELKRFERQERRKNFWAMLIAAFLVLLPAMLLLAGAFYLFIWLLFLR